MAFRDQAHRRADWRKLAIALAFTASLVAVVLAGRWLAGH
jgi:hypothetical protein